MPASKKKKKARNLSKKRKKEKKAMVPPRKKPFSSAVDCTARTLSCPHPSRAHQSPRKVRASRPIQKVRRLPSQKRNTRLSGSMSAGTRL